MACNMPKSIFSEQFTLLSLFARGFGKRSRTPRYCLFGGMPGRMQVSDVTHALVSACGESGMVWERRGEVEVKGKGAMVTYFLAAKELE